MVYFNTQTEAISLKIPQPKIFLLNVLELCVTVFRGPDADTWSALATSGLPELLQSVQAIPCFPSVPVKGMIKALAPSVQTKDFTLLETEYVRLFIAGPGGVPAPLYHSCHLDSPARTMGQPAMDMRERLHAADLETALASNEPPDHISNELEYLYFLLSQGWMGAPEISAQGATFAAEVMLPWVRRFRETLTVAKPHPAFQCAADMTVAALEAIPAI